ncbi:MAG: hypothetical protein K8J09_18870 [Planctomycetes bacterium]|nr:hypothetical protein [Planctomycetota bacterium]
MPFVMSGNFAYVFKVHLTQGGARAVKCFRRFLGDRGQRYEALSQHLDKSPMACVADFDYDAQGILVEGHRYPILVMEWVDGPTLDVFISQLLKTGSQSSALMSLAAEWAQIVLTLEQGGVAHGDLQHGNIIVTTQGLRLVDLDGMFVPTLANKGAADEIGHRHYQHPLRSASDFNAQLDRFSSLVIYASLLGVAADPSLWREFNDDNLILTRGDFQNPGSSTALQRMRRIGGEVSRLTEVLITACRQPLRSVPALSSLITVTRNKLPIWIRQPTVVSVPSATRESVAPPPPAHTASVVRRK